MKLYRFNASGFTLLEMTVVMVIVGLMLGGLMVSLSQMNENTRRSDAKAQLAEVEEALYGFAQTRGRLPCPAIPSSAGAEVCAAGQHGFVPAAMLGLKGPVNADGLLLDPWGNPLRYSVTNANSRAFTTNGQMKLVGISNLQPDLCIYDRAPATPPPPLPIQIASNIPAVVFSMGSHWSTLPSENERENAGEGIPMGGGPSGNTYPIANNVNFVSANYSEVNFDDIITWISPYILYTRMIASGQLP